MNTTLQRLSERLYGLLLSLYPAKFRREFEEEMLYVFSESLRVSIERLGNLGAILLWVRTIIDLLISLPSEHLRGGKSPPGMEASNWVPVGPGIVSLSQPSARKKHYELRANNQLVGTLHWPKAFGNVCVAETAAGSWTFREQGFFRNYRITARAADSDQDLLTYTLNWTGMIGTVRHADGREFKLKGTSWWGNRYALFKKPAQGAEEEMLSLTVKSYFRRASADVEVQPRLAEAEDAALLALFGCFVALIAYETNNMMR